MRGYRAGLAAAAVSAACGLLLWAPAAPAAAPPANDNFENAQAIGPSLPVEVTESNEGATKEPGEPSHNPLGSKGHSVWFEWEATSTEFVTVGTCGSDFRAVASVYTGTKVDELTKVAGDYASEGPGCPALDGREVTFKAIGGTTYEIAVDGEAFYVPPAEPPVGEGTIELQAKVTPTPSNDDFANATVLQGSIEEEEGAEFASYWASAYGFNWNATKQEGEPQHAGDPGGASVWYTWTAPQSGTAHLSGCASVVLLLAVYTGDSLGGLAPVVAEKSNCPGASFAAVAGTTYHIAVDGQAQEGTPAVGNFSLLLMMRLPPRPAAEQPPPPMRISSLPQPDTTPPDTALHKSVLKRRPQVVVFGFSSSEPGSTFRCKRDDGPWVDCRAPVRFAHPGRHVFKVAAVDPSGNVDPSPAVARFEIPALRANSRRR